MARYVSKKGEFKGVWVMKGEGGRNKEKEKVVMQKGSRLLPLKERSD